MSECLAKTRKIHKQNKKVHYLVIKWPLISFNVIKTDIFKYYYVVCFSAIKLREVTDFFHVDSCLYVRVQGEKWNGPKKVEAEREG